MTRARFLAIRDELTRDWRPTTGQERHSRRADGEGGISEW
jgi:hypothetical protein